jgi:ABC-type transport system substrate-binding protein
VTYNSPLYQNIGGMLAASLEQLGVRVEVEGLDYDALRARLYQARDFDLYLVASDADAALGFYTRYADGGNPEGWDNPQAERMLERAMTEPDTALRRSCYYEWLAAFMRELPQIPVAAPREYLLASPKVLGLAPNSFSGFLWNAGELKTDG